MKIGLFLHNYITDNWKKIIGHLLIIVYELMFLNYIIFMWMACIFFSLFKAAILPSKCLFQSKLTHIMLLDTVL